MERKLISVIIPIYNAEKYLNQCIDSILQQTYKNLELILVDDGSKDRSSKILDEYAAKDSRVKCIRQPNGGCSSARNNGISQAKGDYIAFVDADDVLDFDFYEILVGALEKTGSDVSASTYKNEYGEIYAVSNKEIPEPVIFSKKRDCMASITSKANSIEGYVWNKVWTRKALAGQFFSDEVAIVDDAYFTWEGVLKNVDRACYIDLPMYHYRIIKSSITRNSSLDKYFKALYAYELMTESALDKGYSECLNGLCTDYIIWNEITCERMYISDLYTDSDFYKIQSNIHKYSKYINRLNRVQRLTAKAILRGWGHYRLLEWGKLTAKKVLIK